MYPFVLVVDLLFLFKSNARLLLLFYRFDSTQRVACFLLCVCMRFYCDFIFKLVGECYAMTISLCSEVYYVNF